jgi:predicted nucleic acid-binding Zn ribbon protein
MEEDQEEIMPVYEFECDTCGVVSEEFYPIIPREVPTHLMKPCGQCGDIWSERSHKKVLSLPTFHLKGGGWAKDGYGPQLVDGSPIVSIDEPKT